MPSFLSPIDLNRNEVRNSKIHVLGSDPTGLVSGDAGLTWFNSSSGLAKYWDGAAAQVMTQVSGSSTNIPNTLVARDFAGDFAAGTITAALTGTASNASALGSATLSQVRDFSLTTGQRTATSAISDFDTAVRLSRLDQLTAPTASVNLGGQQAINAADPTTPTALATKQYVDSLAAGLDVKGSVRAATLAALPSNVYANGTSGVGATLTGSANGALTAQDGWTPVVGGRLLVKNEVTGANNGIYTVTQVGAAGTPYILTRATDADQAAEVTGGMFTFIESTSSTLGGSGWSLSGTGTFVIGTTAQVFAQFTGGAAYTAGNGVSIAGNVITVLGTTNRISVSGSGVDIAATYVGQSSITTLGTITAGVWTGTAIALANGGTGATTAQGARTALKAAGVASIDVPAGASYAFVHNLNSTDIGGVFLKEISSGVLKSADYTVTDANTLTLTFGAAVGSGAYRVTVVAGL